MYYNSQNNKVYCSDYGLGVVWIIDGAGDSLLCSIDVPGGPMRFTWNTADNRTYVSCYKTSRVAILRDSLVQGVQEAPRATVKAVSDQPTVARGVLFLAEAPGLKHQAAALLDISGRKVMDLHPCANDVRVLAPGVYFVREAQAQAQPQAIHKVVITR